MTIFTLISAINEILQAQSAPEVVSVLDRYPKLLEQENLMKMVSMIEQDRENGRNENAEALQLALQKIAAVVQPQRETIQPESLPQIEPKVEWAIKARRSQALQKPELLAEAITIAQDYPEIVNFLHAFQQEDIQKIDQQIEKLHPQLLEGNREEEAATIYLLYHHTRAELAESFTRYHFDQQRRLRKMGIQSCHEVLEIALMLQDKPCQAFYTGILALGYQHDRQFPKAEYFYFESLAIYRELAETEPQIFLPDVGKTLNNLGIAQADQKKFREAENSYLEALEIRRKLAETEPQIFLPDLTTTLNNLGNTQIEQRKFREAENTLLEAFNRNQEFPESDSQIDLRISAGILNNLGNTQRAQLKFRLAENSYLGALEKYGKLLENDSQIDLPNFAGILNNLGLAQRVQRKFKEAENSFLEALGKYRELVVNEPKIYLQNVAMTLNNLGNAQNEQNKSIEAEKSFLEAVEKSRKLAENEPQIYLQYVALTLNNLGNAQRDLKKFREAENSYLEALEIRRKLAETEPQIFLPNVAMTLSNLGYFYLESDLQKAEINYEEARDLVERFRANAMTIDDKTRIMEENSRVYQGLLMCYLKQKNWEKVLEIAELSKSRSLTDLLNLKVEDLQPKAQTPDTKAKVQDLGNQYTKAITELQRLESSERFLNQQLHQATDNRKRIESDRELDDETKLGFFTQIKQFTEPLTQQQKITQNERIDAEAKLKEVLANIKVYDENFPPAAADITIDEIKSIAKDKKRTIVMFRVLNDSTAIIFVFPDGKLEVTEVEKFGKQELLDLYVNKWLIPYETNERASLEYVNALDNFKRFQSAQNTEIAKEKMLENDEAFANWEKMMLETLHELDEKLIFKVREVLENKKQDGTEITDVLFVPNQSLALLPLHVACRTEKDTTRYFLSDYNVSYCSSVSVFQRCLKNEPERTEKTLGILTPSRNIYTYEAEQHKMLEEFNPRYDKIAKEGATSGEVLTALNKEYGIIHFYCHGVFGEGDSFGSGLEMSDKTLKLNEIINCNLQKNWLTVLSACETGMVDAGSATDEHLGLPLGFVFAGSPSIWASLWSVKADKTSDLMEKAYRNLNRKEYRNNKSEALRQAQIEMSQDTKYSHPFYWAGFQHFGV